MTSLDDASAMRYGDDMIRWGLAIVFLPACIGIQVGDQPQRVSPPTPVRHAPTMDDAVINDPPATTTQPATSDQNVEIAALHAVDDQCAGDRESRRQHVRDHEAWMVKRNALVDWMNDHCIIDDVGHDEVGDFMQPDGTIIRRMHHVGGPVRKCKGKPPEPLPPDWRNDYSGEPMIPSAEVAKNAQCMDTP